MKRAHRLLLSAAVCLPAISTAAKAQSETIVTADRIYTSDDFRPVAEAMLIRISVDQILRANVMSTWLGGKAVYRRGSN